MKSSTLVRPRARAEDVRARPTVATRLLAGLLVFQGVGAVGGGAVMVADPSGAAMGWDPSLLGDAPFSDFLWPGLILGFGLGVTALVLAYGVIRRPRWRTLSVLERATGQHWAWVGSVGLGAGLMSWIVVQMLLIEFRSFLQPLMFTVGTAIVAVALLPAVRRQFRAQ